MYNSEGKKWQRCYQSESGTGELLRVKIQFPQVTHPVHSTIHRLCRKRCIGCGKNVQLCFNYKSDVRAEKMSEKVFYCDTFTNSKKGSVDFNTFILCQYWFKVAKPVTTISAFQQYWEMWCTMSIIYHAQAHARAHTHTLQHAVNHTHYMKGGNSDQCPLDSKGSKLHPQSVCASFGHGWESLWVKQYTTNNTFRQEFNILDT